MFQEATDPGVVERIADVVGHVGVGCAARAIARLCEPRAIRTTCRGTGRWSSRHAFLELLPAGTGLRVFGVHLSAIHCGMDGAPACAWKCGALLSRSRHAGTRPTCSWATSTRSRRASCLTCTVAAAPAPVRVAERRPDPLADGVANAGRADTSTLPAATCERCRASRFRRGVRTCGSTTPLFRANGPQTCAATACSPGRRKCLRHPTTCLSSWKWKSHSPDGQSATLTRHPRGACA